MFTKKSQHRAEGFILASAAIEGGFPLVANRAVQLLPALYFGAIASLIGGCVHVLLLAVQGKLIQKVPRRVWLYLVGVAFFNTFLGYGLILLGTGMTSGINTSLLLQFEMIFSFLIYPLIMKDRVTRKQILGSVAVFLGTIIVLYNGSFSINRGELLILCSTACFPFGNMCAKKALEYVPSGFVLGVRSLLSGIGLLTVSLFVEQWSIEFWTLTKQNLWYILFFGLVVTVISKLAWYEGVKVLPLTKAVSIILAYPAFSLLFAVLFFDEVPSVYQLLGFLVTIGGLYLLISKRTLQQPVPDVA